MDSISRPGGLLLGLGCLLTMATVGCQSMKNMKPGMLPKPPAPTKAARPTGKNDQPNLPKTDFQRNITKNQEFGVHIDMGKLQESQGNFFSSRSIAALLAVSRTASRRRSFSSRIASSTRSRAICSTSRPT